VEQGLVGLILLGLMIVIAVQLLLKARNEDIISEHSSVWIASMIVIFFTAQFSGDLNDNRILLMFLAIALSSVHLDGLFMKERGSRLIA